MSDPNLPVTVFHRNNFIAIAICGAGVLSLWLGFNGLTMGAGISAVFLLGPVLAALALLVEVKRVSFHDKGLSVEYYLLRKRHIEYDTIDFVEWEHRRGSSAAGGLFFNYKLVCLTLSNRKKIRLAGFKEGDEVLYEKLKGYSTENLGMFANVFVNDDH